MGFEGIKPQEPLPVLFQSAAQHGRKSLTLSKEMTSHHQRYQIHRYYSRFDTLMLYQEPIEVEYSLYLIGLVRMDSARF